MRIMQVHTHYRQGGGEDDVVATELRLLQEAGHEVLAWRSANPYGARAAASLAAAPWNPAAARRARGAARSFRPDVVHVHNTWYASSPAVIAGLRELGIPVVMTLHNYRLICAAATLFRDGAPCEDCIGDTPFHAVSHRCYRDSAAESLIAAGTIALHTRRGTWQRDVDRFIALSEFGRERFIAGGLPASKITLKANSVGDPGPRPQAPSASRSVVFVGRLSEEKGLHVLLEAWRSARSNLQLVIVGEGPLASSLQRSAPESVTLAGRRPHGEVLSLLMTARALVLPSLWYEGQPVVALEAIAAGLPVLLSDLGAMTELLGPGAGSALFPPGDVDALRDRIRSLEEDTFVDVQGDLNRRRFVARFSHSIATQQLETIYRSVLPAPSTSTRG
jgi:glycosyltransferase involved in cell wall biosynthesis